MAAKKSSSKYSFKSEVWKYKGKGAWFFATLPKKLSQQIRLEFGASEEGWGRLKAIATIGETKWDTAIWFDTKSDAYLLPVKSIVRKAEGIEEGESAKVSLHFPMVKSAKNKSAKSKIKMFR